MDHSSACKDARGRAGGIAALGLASGIAVPLLVTRGKDVHTGDVIVVNRSTLIGAMHGYIIPFAAGLDNKDLDDVRALSGLTFAGDLLGVGVGSYFAYRYDLSPGRASFIGTLHSATFLAAISIGNSIPDDITQRDERIITGVSLGLADLALGIGLSYLDRIDIGRHRVFWLDTGAIIGWIGGGGIGAIFGGNSKRAVAIGSTLGMAAGIVLTYWATDDSESWRRRHEPDPPAPPRAAVRLEPPMLRVEPEDITGRGPRVAVDALRGSF
jgi:hypothetical protein